MPERSIHQIQFAFSEILSPETILGNNFKSDPNRLRLFRLDAGAINLLHAPEKSFPDKVTIVLNSDKGLALVDLTGTNTLQTQILSLNNKARIFCGRIHRSTVRQPLIPNQQINLTIYGDGQNHHHCCNHLFIGKVKEIFVLVQAKKV